MKKTIKQDSLNGYIDLLEQDESIYVASENIIVRQWRVKYICVQAFSNEFIIEEKEGRCFIFNEKLFNKGIITLYPLQFAKRYREISRGLRARALENIING